MLKVLSLSAAKHLACRATKVLVTLISWFFAKVGVESRRGRPFHPGSRDRRSARSPRRILPDTPEQLLESALESIRQG